MLPRITALLIFLCICGLFAPPSIASAIDGCSENLPYGPPEAGSAVRATSVCHAGYAASFDDDHLVPVWVSYVLTGQHTMGCNPRTNDFHEDEQLDGAHQVLPTDYAHSGFDRGHQAPAEDFAWDRSQEHDSFSMANMAPQLPGLNRQGWERLEESVRAWAWERGTVYVLVGPILSVDPPTIGVKRIAVPDAFWKIVIDPAQKEAIGYVMPQANIPKGSLEPWQKSVLDIQRMSGINFRIPPPIYQSTVRGAWETDLVGWRSAHRQSCSRTYPRD